MKPHTMKWYSTVRDPHNKYWVQASTKWKAKIAFRKHFGLSVLSSEIKVNEKFIYTEIYLNIQKYHESKKFYTRNN